MSFSLTRKTDYALVALSALARQGLDDDQALSARQLATSNGLPQQLLMNVLKELHRAGLVGSRRGASGGYYLELAPEEITLKRVIEVFDGPVNVALCSGDHPNKEDGTPCAIVSSCPISKPIRKFDDLLNQFLDQITLRQLFDHESPVAMPIGVIV